MRLWIVLLLVGAGLMLWGQRLGDERAEAVRRLLPPRRPLWRLPSGPTRSRPWSGS